MTEERQDAHDKRDGWDEEASPPEEIPDADPGAVADRRIGASVEGDGGEDTDRDQHHPPDVGGVICDHGSERAEQAVLPASARGSAPPSRGSPRPAAGGPADTARSGRR